MASTSKLVDADGFTVVTAKSKRRIKGNSGRAPSRGVGYAAEVDLNLKPSDAELDRFVKTISLLRNRVQTTPLFKRLVKSLVELSKDSPFEYVVCLGLGPLGSTNSMLQLAVLCELINECGINFSDSVKSFPIAECRPMVATTGPPIEKILQDFTEKGIFHPVISYDPAHSLKDTSKLRLVGIHSCLSGKLHEYAHGRGLFFMPHCERDLYSTLVDTRVTADSSFVVVGNSFKNYVENTPKVKDSVARLVEAGAIEEVVLELQVSKESGLDESEWYFAFHNTVVIIGGRKQEQIS